MKIELSDEEVKLLISALGDLTVALVATAPSVKGVEAKICNQYVISLGLLQNKIKKQSEGKE